MIDKISLVKLLTIPKHQKTAGAIFMPRSPIEISPEIHEEMRPDAALEFEYDSFGAPTSSFCSIQTIPIKADSAAIVLVREEMPIEVFACLEPFNNQELWSIFISELFFNNGAEYNVEIFTLLPTSTRNYQPDLISRHDLRVAYWQFMKWAETNKPLPWINLNKTLKQVGIPSKLNSFEDFDWEEMQIKNH